MSRLFGVPVVPEDTSMSTMPSSVAMLSSASAERVEDCKQRRPPEDGDGVAVADIALRDPGRREVLLVDPEPQGVQQGGAKRGRYVVDAVEGDDRGIGAGGWLPALSAAHFFGTGRTSQEMKPLISAVVWRRLLM